MKKEDFIPGKWYKDVDNLCKFISKFSHFDEDNFCTVESIYIYNGEVHKVTAFRGRMTTEFKNAKECPLEEIQHLLPEGHPDKFLLGYTVDGQIYTTEYKDQGLYIFRASGDNSYVTFINPFSKTYVNTYGDLSRKYGFKNYIPANKEQKDHFNLCVKMGKYVDYSNTPKITMQKRIEELSYPDVIYIKNKEEWDKLAKYGVNLSLYENGYFYYLAEGYGKHTAPFIGTPGSESKSNCYINYNFEDLIFPTKLEENMTNNDKSWSIKYTPEFTEEIFNHLIKWCTPKVDGKKVRWRGFSKNESYSDFQMRGYFVFFSLIGVDNNSQNELLISLNELCSIIGYNKNDSNREVLFQEAIKRYPIGCTFKVSHLTGTICTVVSHDRHKSMFVVNPKGHLHINLLTREGESEEASASVYANGTWAEIVTLPSSDNSPKKEYTYKVVHCKTQEEWDFVISKVPCCSSTTFKSSKYDVTPGGIELAQGSHCTLDWFRKKNSLIYSFEEWCKLNNYNMPKSVETFKRGDWVIFEGETNEWYTKGQAYKLGGKYYSDNFDNKTKGCFFTEKDDKGTPNGCGNSNWTYRKALPNEIPNEENGDWCVQITPDNKESVKEWWKQNCSAEKTFSLNAYYGIKDSKYEASGFLKWGKVLSTQEFYQKIGVAPSYSTDKESLLAEAQRRFPIGSKYKCANGNVVYKDYEQGWDYNEKCWIVEEYNWIDSINIGIYSQNGWILLNGKWATPVVDFANNTVIELPEYKTFTITLPTSLPPGNSTSIKIQAEVSNIIIPKSASVTLKNTEREVKINVKQVNSIKI